MTRFKYIFKRKIESILLWILFLTSVFLVLKSSDEPILSIFQNSIIESIFNQFTSGNTLINSISTGLIVSLVFYLIVVHIPKKRNQQDINPHLKEQCESIIFTSYIIINDISSKTELKYDFESLTKAQFEEICENVNPKGHFSTFHNGIGNLFENHLGYKLFNNWTRVEHEIENLLRLLPYIETGLLKKIYDLKNCNFKLSAKDLSQVEKLGNDNLKAWSSQIYEVYTFSKELRDYCKLYFNTELKNDPWNK